MGGLFSDFHLRKGGSRTGRIFFKTWNATDRFLADVAPTWRKLEILIHIFSSFWVDEQWLKDVKNANPPNDDPFSLKIDNFPVYFLVESAFLP